MIAVPGGTVNAAGGNLMIERLDMSIDTVLGTQEIRAVYNAHSGDWLWNYQVTYDGSEFHDPTGARNDVDVIAHGAAIPGTVYVKADADTIETKGGLAFHFGASGALDYIAWKTGAYPRIQHTRSASTLEIAQCTTPQACLPFYSIALNAAGDPLSVTDARTGRVADFQYDGLGRLVVARDALAVDEGWPGFQYEYSVGGTLLTAITNSEGERIEYAYQGNRRIRDVIQIGEGNPTHRFRYTGKDGAGFYKTLHTNPLGALTRYVVDGRRRLHSVELAETGERVTITWEGNRPSSTTLADGSTTLYSYIDDDLATVTQPSGNVVSYSYEPDGVNYEDIFASATNWIEDSIGLVEERIYDAQGRVTDIANGEGDTTSFSYSGFTVASENTPPGIVHTFPIYGVHGHWLDRGGALADKRSFDPVGNAIVTSVRIRPGGFLARGYDGDRNLSSLDLAATQEGVVTSQASIAIARRSDGQTKYVQRPRGADHCFEYDAVGRVVRQREWVDGQWQTTTFEYDAAGNLTARERPNGMREEFVFDGYGRLLSRRALRDGQLEGEAVFTHLDGQLVSVFDSIRDATEFYGYDTAGRLISVQFESGESIAAEYDLRSRITAEELFLPGQGSLARLEYAYDLADRLVLATGDGGEALIERIYQAGQLVSALYGNGLVRDFDYDPETGLLASSTTKNDLDEVVELTIVERSVEEDPVRHQIAVRTDTTVTSTEEQYWLGVGGSFANPDRLVGKRVFAWNDGGGASKSFVYDELSNMMSNSDGDAFVYNPERNRLLSATLAHEGVTITYSYDEAGFATSRDGVPITWTATGRMATYGPASIDWDMLDRPIRWTAAGIIRDFSLFGGRVEADPVSGAPMTLDLGEVAISLGSGDRRYRHLDFRGNVSFVSDENGGILSHYCYSPYGVDRAFGSAANTVTFVGRNEIGPLMTLGARMYDPVVGRFLSPDPIFAAVNHYAYTFGNPVWYWDPDGAQQGAITGAQVRAVLQVTAGALAVVAAAGVATGASPALVAAATITASVIVVSLAIDELLTTCAPTAFRRAPGPGWILAFLTLLQLLLGALVLRHRRPEEA
jgi:RHS repeat-associated protein